MYGESDSKRNTSLFFQGHAKKLLHLQLVATFGGYCWNWIINSSDDITCGQVKDFAGGESPYV